MSERRRTRSLYRKADKVFRIIWTRGRVSRIVNGEAARAVWREHGRLRGAVSFFS
jgi:hypothetical protein